VCSLYVCVVCVACTEVIIVMKQINLIYSQAQLCIHFDLFGTCDSRVFLNALVGGRD